MANWALLQEQLTGKQVVKRAKHGIHFDNGDGQTLALFSGAPCHYEDAGIWKPIDTKLLLGADGFYGCPHSPVKVKPDGRVKVTGSDYSQFTEFPGSPLGRVDGDKIVREFPGGYQELFVTEDGFREVITVNKPTFPIEKFLAKQSGTLPSAYKTSPQTAVDANGSEFVITSDTKAFGDWLNAAVYPVVIDPDFSASGFLGAQGGSTTYLTARATATATVTADIRVGQYYVAPDYIVRRQFLKFDTSSIGAGSTINQVNFSGGLVYAYSSDAYDVEIVGQDWSEFDADQTSTAKRDAAFDACLAGTSAGVWINTGTSKTRRTKYTSANLDTSIVAIAGTTYISMRSSLDVAGTAPDSEDRITLFLPNEGTYTTCRPTLTVTYTEASTGALLKVNFNAGMRSLNGGMYG